MNHMHINDGRQFPYFPNQTLSTEWRARCDMYAAAEALLRKEDEHLFVRATALFDAADKLWLDAVAARFGEECTVRWLWVMPVEHAAGYVRLNASGCVLSCGEDYLVTL